MTVLLRRVWNYEELDGGRGREVFFRPHRHSSSDLEPLATAVSVRRGQGPALSCALVDISQKGLAFEWRAEERLSTGETLAELTVRVDDYLAYRGKARVSSVREQAGRMVVGVSFEQLIDIDEILQMRVVRSWHARGLSASARPWNVPGNWQFKALVSDLALYLEDMQVQLGELESSLDLRPTQREGEAPAIAALVGGLEHDFVAEVVHSSEAIDAALRMAAPADKKALNAFTLRQLDRFLMRAPWMHRARHKPFGYPGDYEVMRFVYERNFEGPTLFAKAVGYAFLQTKAALAVKYRKDLVKRQLLQAIERHGSSRRPLRFLSIAAGPAQELVELVGELPSLSAPLEVVLFDQDKSALSYAYKRLEPAVEAKFPGQVKVLYLHESIKRLLRDSNLFAGFGHFDAIYSAGLYDYLQPNTAVVLTRNLFERLMPGGALYVGNMAPENDCRWFMESHLEWHLIHRTREEMTEIGHRANEEALIRVLEEETGVNPFIELRAR